MAPVKVFGPALSTNVARVLVCLEEVGAEYEVINIDFDAGEHKGPEHLARNPFGQIPAFQDGDLKLFESRAISRYVLRKYKTNEVNLLREGNLEDSALVDVWLDVEAHQYNPAISPIIYQHYLVPMRGGTPDQKLIGDSIQKMKKVLDVYEAQLSKCKYLAGDFVSLADLSHFPYTFYLMATPYWSVFDSYPRVKAWWEDLMSRPAVQRTVAQLPKSSDELCRRTMSATMSSSRAILRQSRTLLRQHQFRQASSTTEKAGEVASKAKDTANTTVSKASEGLTRVTSSAGSSVSNAASSAQSALGRIGGRTGRMIKFVESLIPPTVYYARVGLELGRLVAQHQKMTPPSISSFQSYFQPLANVVRNPKSITSTVPTTTGQALSQVRNANGQQWTTYAIILAQVLGFFTVGEMIGRLKVVGYHGEVHHDEH